MNKIKIAAAAGLAAVLLAGCTDSDVASHNLSKEADSYKVYRQIVVYNLFTDKYVLEIKGFCSLGNDDQGQQITYTCKVGEDKYIKDIIRGGDNRMVFAHQLKSVGVSPDSYQVIYKPSVIVPDVRR